MIKRNRLGLLAAVLCAPLAVTSAAFAASAAPDAWVEKGSLTYGVAASFAPFEFVRGGELMGFDIDLVDALASKLAVKPVPLNMEFKGLIPALQGKRTDIINSAMYINPARAEQVDFVPYLKIGNRVIVLAGNPAKVTGRDDSLCGKQVAVTLGGIQESQARADDERCRKAGLEGVKVMTLPTAQDAALTLRAGRADAVFDSTPGAVKLLTDVPGVFATVGDEFESSTLIGLAVRKGDEPTKAALQEALKQVMADGTYTQLIEKWKFPDSVAIAP
ncbi:ABC transporter substrate-binding protein [Pseudomonas typographi]|uniref:ABC transporter substrate-binding protein n=1 Tax=Pseudomonas typographi TaxID=2715964 RepID=A0ABR7Z488_9PSED|nr:ABC transporter substrate-binding protein [Pseudomonas typographi]MBD1552939.1 ABC transporter substrate-binding protein [Pseudomonas typographi]MBD1588314.1 ABC transporter substrate-binding protein [Pseudomonas typographi]MBD1600285.1 ABC transporter substrate-binding protein [Pseudomonas typographi]